ncbi:TonB-dependent receptor [Dyella nitratireducens]|uniref:TonB-dependent receptor n=1 Tax=Dyella nitratireducens TaxID=1849580 RepID=A0ABQ1FY05_9GAMM|nr:TonB-dependent receptor [Dyella nitratireducens]GGA33659.1 TonB-dependent receptor [Dyella nitratireducens]GLQ40758.1 TonB-dependent receptor [Dyella nitratireducens]
MKRTHLSAAIAMAFYLSAGVVAAQTASNDQAQAGQSTQQRVNASSTSNTTTSNATERDVKQMSQVTVQGQSLSLGGGLMSVQIAPKAVSTITRDAIEKASPGSNFTQMIATIPGVNAATDDVTGLANGHYSIRGYDSSDIGMTVNGAPITDTGSYSVYATEYGDSENMGDITVLQGIPDVDMPDSGASGGHIGWATIDPPHQGGVDFTQTIGGNDYRRTFFRLNTGDLGPVRSWLSYSDNTADKWRGDGKMDVTKVDGKSVWTIDDNNSISASLQYNRENNIAYESVSKQQVAQNGYFTDYNTTWIPTAGLTGTALKNAISNDTYYYGLRTNPFRSYLFSLDGEFKLADSLHVSVIPYFWYGNGGGGSSATVTESTSTANRFGYTDTDINNSGNVVNNSQGVVYSYSAALTYRPGVLVKFNQDFGLDNSLEYGFWYEDSRKTQDDSYFQVNAQGTPVNLWGTGNYVVYPNGMPMTYYHEYTNTEIEKGFVTDNWTPTDQWTFTAGTAFLHATRDAWGYDYPGSYTGSVSKQQIYTTAHGDWNKLLPTAGIKFQLNEKNQFYIGTGKTFRVPTNTVLLLNSFASQDLSKPETSWNTDLGWRYYGDAISASADVYNSNYNNKQESAYDNANGQTYYTSIPRMHMRGFNGELSYKFAPSWTVYSSYTYTKADIVGNLNGGGNGIYLTNGRMMPDTAKNIGNLSLSYDDSHLWAELTGRVTSQLYGDYMNTETVGGFTTFTFNAGYRFGDWDWLKKPYIKLNVTNLTDKHAFSYVSSAQFLAAASAKLFPSLYGSAPTYGLLQPRTYMVTVGASFF